MTKRVALITGGNRGLGFETARQLAAKGIQVVIACRSPVKAKKAQKELKTLGLSVDWVALDLNQEAKIRPAVKKVFKKYKRIDILVNNAGVFLDPYDRKKNQFESAVISKSKTVLQSFKTNTLGPFLLTQQVFPIMVKNHFGRIVNVSSGMGQLTEMDEACPGYRISKTALNAVTRIFAAEARELGESNILVNSVCPGWVRTDMGGSEADLSVEQGADTIAWLAMLSEKGSESSLTGGFYRERTQIAW